jgi:drug/metabolite transporter (DMT)-like permease
MSLIFAGLSALLYGVADFSGGFASTKNRTRSVLVVSQAAGILLALAALVFFWPGPPRLADLGWGLLAGVSGALGLFMLYRGIATSLVSVVSPSSALVSALLPLAFGLIIGERPSVAALVGAGLCLPAVILLSMGGKEEGKRAELRSALIQGCVAGVGFGFFFIAVSRTSPDSGLWPLIASRSASLCIILATLLIRREKLEIAKGSRAITLAAGLADMGANICFLLASRTGLLSLASIVSSLYPAPTVILGRIVFKEKIPVSRLAGLLLAIGGVVLISLK